MEGAEKNAGGKKDGIGIKESMMAMAVPDALHGSRK